MLKVGLTGGIGSGKSEVSRRLAARGAVVIDADVLAREVLAPRTAGLDAVVAAFGPGVLDAHGALDRPALARRVFAEEEARSRLNAIVHPLVRAETARRFAAAPSGAIVVNDVPLLVETGLAAGYDIVVVVEAPQAERVERLRARGMTAEEAVARMAAQASDDERRAVAGLVIRNDGDLAGLDARVEQVWTELRGLGGRPSAG